MAIDLVSVIIPCYRQAHFLPEALESIFAQSYPAVEVIVVNDGSDDDTETVARRYGERIRYVWKTNGGLSSARNAGIAAAAGKYLLFLDADDLLHPDALARLVEASEGRENVVSIITTRTFANDISEDGEIMLPPEAPTFLPALFRNNLAPVHAHLCPRRIIDVSGGFDETLTCLEDWDLWLRVALQEPRLISVPHLGAFYRRYPGSMSTNHTRMRLMRAEVIIRNHTRLIRHSDLFSKYADVLFGIERDILRFCLAQRMPGYLTIALEKCLHDFATHVQRNKSFLKHCCDTLFGTYSERLCLLYFRLFERATFRYYLYG